MNRLQTYKAVLNDNEDGMFCISLVQAPAVECNFLAFSKNKTQLNFKIENEEERIITGVIMRTNYPIYREQNGQAFYLIFEKDTIEKMVIKWLSEGNVNNLNGEHNTQNILTGVMLREVFIKDSSKNINPIGFEDIEDGSLFATYKVLNDDVWQQIKDGTFKGFSLEGVFDIEISKSEEEKEWEEVLELLKKVINKEKK